MYLGTWSVNQWISEWQTGHHREEYD